MKRIIKYWIILAGLIFLASCDSSAKPTITTVVATPLPSITVTATELTEPMMTDSLVELYVGQQSKEGYGAVSGAPYINDHIGLHTMPLHLPLHDDMLYLFFSFKKGYQDVLDSLLKQIKVSPGVFYEINPTATAVTNEVRYKMDVGDFDQAVTIQFGNTPEIHIFRTEPIKVNLVETDYASPALLFPSTGNAMGLYLLTPDKQSVTFAFSESIDPAQSNIEPNLGKWIDDTHYRIKLTAASFIEIPRLMFDVKSVRGNKLDLGSRGLSIRFIKDKAWFNGSTTKEIIGGPRIYYYDNFIYSPNQLSYVANVFLEGPFGDEGGGYYGLVLEQPRKTAVILETDYHIAGPAAELQVYWLDDHRLIYKSGARILLYNVASNQKIDLLLMPDLQKGYINSFTYDPLQKKLHVIWIKYDESGDASLNTLTHSLYEITDDDVQIISQGIYNSESIDAYKYQTLALAMHPVKSGFYWTKVNKRIISTEYISNKGSKTQAKGKIIGVGELGVYLLAEPSYGTEGYGDYINRELYYWKHGTDVPKQILLPDYLGELKAFGQSLSAQSKEITNLNFRYDLTANQWFPLNKQETITTVPYQETMAIYRQDE